MANMATEAIFAGPLDGAADLRAGSVKASLQRGLAAAGLIVAAGLLQGAWWVFPRWWAVAWIGQALVIGIAYSCTPRRAALAGVLLACVGNAWAYSWAPQSLTQCFDANWGLAHLIFAAMVLWESLAFGVFSGVAAYVGRQRVAGLFLAPFVWVAVEHWWPRIFPWVLGYSQREVLPVIQIAELAGACGVSFFMMAVAAVPSAWMLWRRNRDCRSEGRWFLAYVAAAVCLTIFVLGFGYHRLAYWRSVAATGEPRVRVAVLQVDPAWMGSDAKLHARSVALRDWADLICWPESSVGTYRRDLTDFTDPERTLRWSRDSRDSLRPSEGVGRDLLAGGKTYPPDASAEGPYAQTAFLIDPQERIVGRYQKRTLIPFGEYIPGQRYFPQLREWATLTQVIEPGDDVRPLVTSGGLRVGVLICYEDLLRGEASQTVGAGAEVLFSLINGSAFTNPRTLEQHRQLAWMRAVEHRRFFVRCAGTGVTCVVSPAGEIVAELNKNVEGTLLVEIVPLQCRTLYSVYGEVLPWSCLLVTAGVVAVGWVRRRRCGRRR